MAWINNREYADKFIKLFAENRILGTQWKYWIPMNIVQQPLPIIINAKNFADGIQHNIELYGIQIPDDALAYDTMDDEEYLSVVATMANRYLEKE
jgi:hypothetical protein